MKYFHYLCTRIHNNKRKKYMTRIQRTLALLALAVLVPLLPVLAQDVAPKAYYLNKDQIETETDNISDGEAPLPVTFKANPVELGDWTPSYEWHFSRQVSDTEWDRFLVRYDEQTDYTFYDSGAYRITLKTTLALNGDTIELEGRDILISIAESKLEMPNGFSPNGDGRNDTYKAKPTHKSIVSFHAYIFNRWGQKLYEWDDVDGEWDGTYHGRDVADGVYFVLVKAKGADGKEYNIRRDVNLLRGNATTTGATTTTP